MAAGEAASPGNLNQIVNRAKGEFKERKLDQIGERLQSNTVELALRAATLKAAIDKGQIPYCDNVYFMALELHQIDALRAEVIADAESLAQACNNITRLAGEIKTGRIKKGIEKLAEQAVASTDIQHYNSYSWNVAGRSSQCSSTHCYGPEGKKL